MRRVIQPRRLAVILWVFISLFAPAARALPPNFIDQVYLGGWNQAVGLRFAADGRMIVWEKGGRAWTVVNGVRDPQPLLDISEEVGDWRDHGMLGLALDPNFLVNGYIYVLYAVDYHYLAHFGTPQYDPNTDEYFHDTIGRITRYQCNAADNFHTVNYNSRAVLVGESITTGFPITHQSHACGTLLFGADGTLLASFGDGASYETIDVGGPRSGSSNTALIDGIIRPKEDVGSFRSQLVDSLNGKIIRIDPATGDAVPSNPFYNASAPRSARSRVWALGFRNPFRMTIRPATGDSNPANANPGSLYVGDVGLDTWEELSIVRAPGHNYGWPAYEGLTPEFAFNSPNVYNQDAPNPLFGVGTCTAPYFNFRDLIIQDTQALSFFPNPCDWSFLLPANVDHFIHNRPAVAWGHPATGPALVPIFSAGAAAEAQIGAPGSPVAGLQFGGNCSIGGVWYTGDDFPAEYKNTYFHADFGRGWIRQFIFDASDNLVEVRPFHDAAGSVVCMATSPIDGGLYYVAYDEMGQAGVRRVSWVSNAPPIANAAASPAYGPAPLSVQFSSAGSFDPEGAPLAYFWDFGDGFTAAQPNPTHVYAYQEDITSLGTFVARIFSLSPPTPTGGGNHDPEVMRDGDFPPVGNQEDLRQYDTFHSGQQGTSDWIGYAFAQNRMFNGMVFQEGKQFSDGGWFNTLHVQTAPSPTGPWTDVSNLTISPAYPGANGVSYETFDLSFTPQSGSAIRIQGAPGGSAGFISVGELRVFASPLQPLTAPTPFTATLTVTDDLNNSASASVLTSVNNTPPQVTITSPIDGSLYSLAGDSVIPLTATIFDAEQSAGQLTCRWQTILHHNEHTHPEPPVVACSTMTQITPVGCNGPTYYYEFRLTVTDDAGLSTTVSSFMYPDCASLCLPDLNADGVVNSADLALLLGAWGETGDSRSDLTGDEVVGSADLAVLLGAWGPCP